jgi:hypothetical protein
MPLGAYFAPQTLGHTQNRQVSDQRFQWVVSDVGDELCPALQGGGLMSRRR